MGLCCSVEVVDGDTFKRSYPPEITPEIPACIDEDIPNEGEQEAQDDAAPPPSEAPRAQHTANLEALRRARAARGSIAIIAPPPASSDEVGERV